MASYVKTYRTEIDGEYLDTYFNLDLTDLICLQEVLENFIHEDHGEASPHDLIMSARLLQLIERAYQEHVDAQEARLSEQELDFDYQD